MAIAELYLNLVNNPHIPKVYRDLYSYYKHKNLVLEAKAFQDLLLSQFGEQPLEPSNDSNSYTK
jgi:hypothetical protein